jgi:ATP-binding cassette subfamily B protein
VDDRVSGFMASVRGPVTPAQTPTAPTSGLARRIWALFTPYRWRLVGVGVLVVAGSVIGIINPLLIQRVFDDALFVAGGPDLHKLWLYVGAMVLVAAVGAGISIWQTWLANQLGQNVMADLRRRLFAHLQTLSLRFFTGTRTGEIQSRLTNDVAGVQTVVTSTVTGILGIVVSFVSALIAMVILSWQLTIVALVLVPLFFWLTRLVGNKRREVASQTQKTLAGLTAVTEESLSVSGVLLAKVFHRQADDLEEFDRANRSIAALTVRQNMIGQGFFTIVQAFLSVTPAFVYLVAGYLMGGPHAVTAGTVVAFTTLQTRLYFPIGQLLQTLVELRSSLAYFERIFEYLDMEPDIVERPDALTVDRADVAGHVRYDDVRFRYDGDDDAPWTLDGITLDVPPGRLAALVGPSGAGKTTLGYLLPRLYDVDRGAVTIDGHDVRDLSFASLAAAVGMVTQESYLFHATIRENLRYGKPDATDDEIVDAARRAAIHDRIMSFPEGYDTMVGERGYRLSGGEKQRVAIARVLLHDPQVLLLDEATSALDTASERLIQQALSTAMTGRTTLAIAHRLSTIVAADVIYVVDGGRVVEEGSHDELLALGGLYARLYHEQYGDGTIEARCADGVLLRDGTVVTVPDSPDALDDLSPRLG